MIQSQDHHLVTQKKRQIWILAIFQNVSFYKDFARNKLYQRHTQAAVISKYLHSKTIFLNAKILSTYFVRYLLVQTFKVIKKHLNSLSIHLWMPTIKFNVFSMTFRNNVMSICSTLPKMPSQQSCLGKDFFFKFHSFQSCRVFFQQNEIFKTNISSFHVTCRCLTSTNYDLDRQVQFIFITQVFLHSPIFHSHPILKIFHYFWNYENGKMVKGNIFQTIGRVGTWPCRIVYSRILFFTFRFETQIFF